MRSLKARFKLSTASDTTADGLSSRMRWRSFFFSFCQRCFHGLHNNVWPIAAQLGYEYLIVLQQQIHRKWTRLYFWISRHHCWTRFFWYNIQFKISDFIFWNDCILPFIRIIVIQKEPFRSSRYNFYYSHCLFLEINMFFFLYI